MSKEIQYNEPEPIDEDKDKQDKEESGGEGFEEGDVYNGFPTGGGYY